MQALVEHGHDPAAVEHYTVAKVLWYAGAIVRAGQREEEAIKRHQEQAR